MLSFINNGLILYKSPTSTTFSLIYLRNNHSLTFLSSNQSTHKSILVFIITITRAWHVVTPCSPISNISIKPSIAKTRVNKTFTVGTWNKILLLFYADADVMCLCWSCGLFGRLPACLTGGAPQINEHQQQKQRKRHHSFTVPFIQPSQSQETQ